MATTTIRLAVGSVVVGVGSLLISACGDTRYRGSLPDLIRNPPAAERSVGGGTIGDQQVDVVAFRHGSSTCLDLLLDDGERIEGACFLEGTNTSPLEFLVRAGPANALKSDGLVIVVSDGWERVEVDGGPSIPVSADGVAVLTFTSPTGQLRLFGGGQQSTCTVETNAFVNLSCSQ